MKKIIAKIKANPILWFNGFLIGMYPAFHLMLDLLPQLKEFVPEDTYKVMGIVVTVGNAVIGQLRAQQAAADEVADV